MKENTILLTRLQNKTSCSIEKAQEALRDSDGSLLSAVLYLEKTGETSPPDHETKGFFSSKDVPKEVISPAPVSIPETWTVSAFFRVMKQELFLNYFQMWHQDYHISSLPVFLLLLLFPLTFGSLFLLLLIPLFFNIHYRFSLEGSFLAEFNPIMRRVGKTFASLGKKINKR
ncbi:MAG: hypothetical protein R3Y63_08320 [Eubacteriales bacterium]